MKKRLFMIILTSLLSLLILSQAVLAAPLLKQGSRGTEVAKMQQQLKNKGYLQGAVDGIFGKDTLNAVRKFQSANGLSVDGIAGPKTMDKLFDQSPSQSNPKDEGSRGGSTVITRTLRRGARGEDVKTLQSRLNSLGFSAGLVDGVFGPGTMRAVLAFQGSRGLVVDGVVGRNTITALFAAEELPDTGSGGSDQKDPIDRGDNTERPVFEPWKPANGKINLVWHREPTSMNINADGINVVAPVWFSVEEVSGQITVKSTRASKAYVTEAHAKGYQVWATVRSFTPAITKQVVHNPEIGNHIIGKLLEIVREYGFDGINIDFENMDPADKYLFTDFVSKATKNLHTLGTTVSVDISPKTSSATNWWSACFDRESLAKVVDYVALMSYDEHWSTSPINGPVASINWVEKAIQTTLQEVPSQKLLVGIPLYAYDWISTPIVGEAHPSNLGDYKRNSSGLALTMDEIRGLVLNNSAILRSGEWIQAMEWLVLPRWAEETGTMYLKFIDQQGRIHELWYENHKSIGLKLDLVERYDLAGAASWAYIFSDQDIWNTYKEKLIR